MAYGVVLEVFEVGLFYDRSWHKSVHDLEFQHCTLDSNAWTLLLLHLEI